MNRVFVLVFLVVLLSLLSGCEFIYEYSAEDDYVDVEGEYVYIPKEVKYLIEESVYGYSMPPISRYGYTLYPDYSIYDSRNLPSYVSADFNGDGYSDYAYMFSKVYYSGHNWYLKTKMLIVVSTYRSYKLASEIDLGTVSNHESTPVEEYWAIRLLKSGTHVITSTQNGVQKKITVELENDGIYLASIDPQERSVFYVERTDVHEIPLDLGVIAKKKIENRAQRVIKLQ